MRAVAFGVAVFGVVGLAKGAEPTAPTPSATAGGAVSPSVSTPPNASPPDATTLAKETQNPVADLVSLPFQFNFNTGGGLQARTFLNLNFQPVVPITLSTEWNLIARTIVPIDDYPLPSGGRSSGLGDIQEQLFFAPNKDSGIIWGIGPVASLPTATADAVATGTWAFGPGAVALGMTGPWVIGVLGTQYFPIADASGKPRTNILVVQYFINLNFGVGWALSTGPLNTVNWDASSGQRWTIPLGLGVAKTTVFASQPISVGVQYYQNVVRPDAAGANSLRFTFSFLFPTAKR
jgi:hypothetical protein